MIFRHLLYTLIFTTILLLFAGCQDSSTGDTDLGPEGPIPAANLEAARQYALENEQGDPRGPALVIWYDGEILLEEYKQDSDGQKLHRIWSGSKSFAGLLAAIAVRNELFTFDTTLGELIPQWDPESERGRITIRQLLGLTSGIETASIGNSNQTAEDWLSAGMAYERDSEFVYGPTPFYILSWIFVEVFNTDPVSYLDEHLFIPLGLVRGEWFNVDQIYPNLSFGGQYPALDWLQVGIMLMNGGTLSGIEIIPKEILDELLFPGAVNPAYGITFWLNTPARLEKRSDWRVPEHAKSQSVEKSISDSMPNDLFMMSGAFGQKLYICPSLDLVIVRYGQFLTGNISDDEFFSILMEGVDQTNF